MQRGFATFEVILAALIVALLAGVTVPNVVRVVDKVALDYETKRLYTDLRAVQAFDRMTNMKDGHFGKNIADDSIRMTITVAGYVIEKNSNDTIYTTHLFSNGVTADKSKTIRFDDMGKVTPADSDTLRLTARYGRSSIVFDSVGRFRGGRQ